MTVLPKRLGIILFVLLSGLSSQLYALEILHYIEAGDYSDVIEEATGLAISDDGVVYVSSEEKGSLLKIVDGKITATSLSPSVFKDSDLGGVGLLADGKLVIVNEGSGQVGLVDAQFQLITLFSQSGSDPGELNSPRPVAVSVNRKIYVGDVKNKQVSVFNTQGLFLYSIGKQGSSGDDMLQPSHVSIDAEENVYVLEGPDRFSIYDRHGALLKRIKSRELKTLFGETPELSALTSDLDGRLYLGDRVNNRISIYDWRKNEILDVFGALGQSRSQFRDITYLAVNARGQVAVLDRKNKKVEVYQLEQTRFADPLTSDLIELASSLEVACESMHAFSAAKTLCIKPDHKGIVILGEDGAELGEFASDSCRRRIDSHTRQESIACIQSRW